MSEGGCRGERHAAAAEGGGELFAALVFADARAGCGRLRHPCSSSACVGSVANTSCAQYDDEGLMGAMMGMEGGLEREKALVEADFFNKFEGTRRTYSGRVPMLCCACRASHMWCR